MNFHQSVLLQEVLEYLIINPHGYYVDCTLGEGGHSKAILEKLSSNGILLSLDDDADIQKTARNNLSSYSNIKIRQSNFSNLSSVLEQERQESIDGLLADLGLSMYHYKYSQKGFSFYRDDPLDMTLNSYSPNAYDVVNKFSVNEIKMILYEYGEEKHAYRVANFIKYYRDNIGEIDTTKKLAEIIKHSIISKKSSIKSHLHPATKSFQAIRIFVNQEFISLKKLLSTSLNVVKSGGRIAIITYHSLEDRIVKNFFLKNQSQIKILTKKPIISSENELKENSSARSAKLRVVEKV